jgi:hypothetical protein
MKRLLVILHYVKSYLNSHPISKEIRIFSNKLFHQPHSSKLKYDCIDSDDEGFFDGLSEHNSSYAESRFTKIGNVPFYIPKCYLNYLYNRNWWIFL